MRAERLPSVAARPHPLARAAFTPRARLAGRGGFTLIEVLIVVVILGILAGIVIPQFAHASSDSSAAAFAHDLKMFARLVTYKQHKLGGWPPDRQPGEFPPELADVMDPADWAKPAPIGGQWDYDGNVFGVTAGVSVYQPTRSPAEMIGIDRLIDDGDLTTGAFRQRTDGYIYVLQE